MKTKCNLGKNLREFRKRSGLTQDELAAKLNVKQSSITGWEREISVPVASILPELAKVFDVSIDEFFK